MASDPPNRVVWITTVLLSVLTTGIGTLEIGLEFLTEPDDVIAVRNGALLLNCTAAGIATVETDVKAENITYTWLKDGLLVNDARRTILSNGSLFIKRVIAKKQPRRSDDGTYECIARNHIGAIISRKATLQVAALSRFAVLPQSLTVVQGDLAEFQCSTGGVPPPTITWQKDRQPLPQDNRHTVLASGTLQILRVQTTDAGQYRCTAHNPARTRHTPDARLTVNTVAENDRRRPATLVTRPVSITKVAGETAILECSAAGVPSPVITWTKEGGDLVVHGRISIIGQGSLRVEGLEYSDSGNYVCTATNGQGNPVTAGAKVAVLEGPEPVKVPENVVLPIAHTVRFTCQFSGNPTPVITWWKNGAPIEMDERIKVKPHDNMLITQGMATDSGLYQCRAESRAGQAQHTVRLLIEASEDTPVPPTHLVARPRSSTSIELSWRPSPPRPDLTILAYSVHFSPTQGGAELQKVVQATRIVVDQLQPFTNYTFYVMSYNKKSPSLHSEYVQATTAEDVPIVAPSVSVMPNGATSLRVEWNKLPPDKARGIITGYRVMYGEHGKTSRRMEEVSAERNFFVITGLETNKKYDVRVLAGTKEGFPTLDDSRWPWVTQITEPSTTLVPEPPSVRVQPLNTSAILVQWHKLDSAVLGYKLIFHKPGEQAKKIIFVDNVSEHVLTRLDGDSEYVISLLAFNHNGDGEATVSTVRTSPTSGGRGTVTDAPMLPAPPQRLEAESHNSTSVLVHWQKPPFVDNVHNYTVRFRPAQLDPTKRKKGPVRFITSKRLQVLITGLEAYTMYEFSARSNTDSAVGSYSKHVWCQTQEATPSAPVMLQWTLLGPGLVELRWKAPVQQNGVITSYIVHYLRSGSDEVWQMVSTNGTERRLVVKMLTVNAVYLFKVQAATSVDAGEFTSIVEVHTTEGVGSTPPTGSNRPMGRSDKEVGIIIGVCIGGGCIIICAIIIVLRNRCFPPRSPPPPVDPNASYMVVNGCLPHVNGNGHIPGHYSSSHEMDSFLPMLTEIQENEQVDSKGGYVGYISSPDQIRPQNGFIPNGKCVRSPGQDTEEDSPTVPLRDGCLPAHVCADEPWLQHDSGSLDDIDRSLNEDDLQECVSERVKDSHTRPFPTTGVYNGECVTGVEPRAHRSNGRGGRGSYSKTGASSSSPPPRDPTSHGPPHRENQATSLGHSGQHWAGHDRRDVGGSRSPRQDRPRTIVT